MMNQKDALKKLLEKKSFIEDDVFDILTKRVEKNLKEQIEEENEKFTKKATFIMRQESMSADSLKNLILSEFYDIRLIRDVI